MKTKILTLALAAVFGLGLTQAQEVKQTKPQTKKEAPAPASKKSTAKKSTAKKSTTTTKSEAKPAK